MIEIPYSVTFEGALILWPEDVAMLAFGPGLSLEQVAEVEAMMTAAVAKRRQFLDAEEAAAKVVVLDDHRHRRATTPHWHRPVRGVR